MTKRRRRSTTRLLSWALAIGTALVVSVTFAPQLLAWPYSAERGAIRIYSEAPIPPAIDRVMARSERLLAQSPVDDPAAPRQLYLTNGGWRWHLLALTSRGAFALRRPFQSGIVLNRSDVAADRIENGREVGGTRTLSGVIAHEATHLLVARRYGELRAALLPTWKSEGYADHVARESSLSEADWRQLRAAGASHPAMAYFEGRRRVEAALRASGGDVDALMLGP